MCEHTGVLMGLCGTLGRAGKLFHDSIVKGKRIKLQQAYIRSRVEKVTENGRGESVGHLKVYAADEGDESLIRKISRKTPTQYVDSDIKEGDEYLLHYWEDAAGSINYKVIRTVRHEDLRQRQCKVPPKEFRDMQVRRLHELLREQKPNGWGGYSKGKRASVIIHIFFPTWKEAARTLGVAERSLDNLSRRKLSAESKIADRLDEYLGTDGLVRREVYGPTEMEKRFEGLLD